MSASTSTHQSASLLGSPAPASSTEVPATPDPSTPNLFMTPKSTSPATPGSEVVPETPAQPFNWPFPRPASPEQCAPVLFRRSASPSPASLAPEYSPSLPYPAMVDQVVISPADKKMGGLEATITRKRTASSAFDETDTTDKSSKMAKVTAGGDVKGLATAALAYYDVEPAEVKREEAESPSYLPSPRTGCSQVPEKIDATDVKETELEMQPTQCAAVVTFGPVPRALEPEPESDSDTENDSENDSDADDAKDKTFRAAMWRKTAVVARSGVRTRAMVRREQQEAVRAKTVVKTVVKTVAKTVTKPVVKPVPAPPVKRECKTVRVFESPARNAPLSASLEPLSASLGVPPQVLRAVPALDSCGPHRCGSHANQELDTSPACRDCGATLAKTHRHVLACGHVLCAACVSTAALTARAHLASPALAAQLAGASTLAHSSVPTADMNAAVEAVYATVGYTCCGRAARLGDFVECMAPRAAATAFLIARTAGDLQMCHSRRCTKADADASPKPCDEDLGRCGWPDCRALLVRGSWFFSVHNNTMKRFCVACGGVSLEFSNPPVFLPSHDDV